MEVFHTDRISENVFDQILSILRRGGVIGFPTDTSYGLAADPFNERAIERIFEIKGRAETKPILVLVDSISMVESLSPSGPEFRSLAGRFWPGPLTVVVPAVSSLPVKLTAGTNAVGVRWPDAAFATELIGRFGRPLTATSANRSGMPSAITAGEVRTQLGDSLDALVDGGVLPYRGGSTLLDLTADPPVLLREGPVSFEVLQQFFQGRIEKGSVLHDRLRAFKWGTLIGIVLLLSVSIYGIYPYRQIRDCAVRDEARQADAIVVLGAAQYNGRPSPVLKARLDHAHDLFRKGYASAIITTGSYGPDPNFSEAHVGTQYLVQRGIDPANIITEQGGGTTFDSIRAAAGLMHAKDWKAAIVVSDGFHLFRLKKMFEDNRVLAYTSPAPNSPIEVTSRRFWYSLREVLLFSAYRFLDL